MYSTVVKGSVRFLTTGKYGGYT